MSKSSGNRIPDGWLLLFLIGLLILFVEWVSESKTRIVVTLCVIAMGLIIIFSAMAADKTAVNNPSTIRSESVRITGTDLEKSGIKSYPQSEQITLHPVETMTVSPPTGSNENETITDSKLKNNDITPQRQSGQTTLSHFETMTTLSATIYIGAFIGGLIGILLGYIVGCPASLIPMGIYQAFTKADNEKAWKAVFPLVYRSVVICCVLLGTILAPMAVSTFSTTDITDDCQPASEIWQQWEDAKKAATVVEEG